MNKLDFGVDDSFEGEEEKYKTIEINISQCLSSVVEVQVPEDFEDFDNDELLKDFVRKQIVLPSELISKHSLEHWYVDDFWVGI